MKNELILHKFFDTILDNDLDSLFDFLIEINKDIIDKNIFNVPQEKLIQYNKKNGAPTQLGNYYNVFNLQHPGLLNLKNNLKILAIKASEYYKYNFDDQDYLIHGWFNLDYKTEGTPVSPMIKPEHFHDHSGGFGVPYLHGYYCVNAEPSSTFYQINRNVDSIFENINKNNRAILSETGHPHGRDDWYEEKPRITIAYDITPSKMLGQNANLWVTL
jgi:hypothetical protein